MASPPASDSGSASSNDHDLNRNGGTLGDLDDSDLSGGSEPPDSDVALPDVGSSAVGAIRTAAVTRRSRRASESDSDAVPGPSHLGGNALASWHRGVRLGRGPQSNTGTPQNSAESGTSTSSLQRHLDPIPLAGVNDQLARDEAQQSRVLITQLQLQVRNLQIQLADATQALTIATQALTIATQRISELEAQLTTTAPQMLATRNDPGAATTVDNEGMITPTPTTIVAQHPPMTAANNTDGQQPPGPGGNMPTPLQPAHPLTWTQVVLYFPFALSVLAWKGGSWVLHRK